jgi:hypothetical protein
VARASHSTDDGPSGSRLAFATVVPRRATSRLIRLPALAGAFLAAIAFAAGPRAGRGGDAGVIVGGRPAPLPAVGTTIAGRILAWPDSTAIPGAMITIEALQRSTLTSRDGWFVLKDLPAGTHTLVVRQVGYRPSQVTVRVMALAELPSTEGHYTIGLARLPTILQAVVVRGRGEREACREAGFRGARVDPRVRPVLEQLEANVERMRDVGTRFPLEYRVARTRHLRVETGALVAQRGDTVLRRSDVRRPYSPGQVLVKRLLGERGIAGREMYVPGVVDLADPQFQSTHCFRYGGLERRDGQLLHRIDFAPLDQLYDADVAGSLWLDASTWLLARSAFRLTRVPSGMRVRAVEVTAEYREARPGLVVPEALLTVETVKGVKVGGARVTEFLQRDQVYGWRWVNEDSIGEPREAVR